MRYNFVKNVVLLRDNTINIPLIASAHVSIKNSPGNTYMIMRADDLMLMQVIVEMDIGTGTSVVYLRYCPRGQRASLNHGQTGELQVTKCLYSHARVCGSRFSNQNLCESLPHFTNIV